MTRHLIFVYGSLRHGGENAMSNTFPDSKFVGPATVSGNLYDLGAYPGMLLNSSSSTVVGEVYEVDDERLKELDHFEASSEYWRKQVEITLGTSKQMGWTYEPRSSLCSDRPLITSGDWIEYVKTRSLGSRL
jgi:gamma-glutamylcyclotransferase (GGCT)/AIG2-like uncharacterized protein YtfP